MVVRSIRIETEKKECEQKKGVFIRPGTNQAFLLMLSQWNRTLGWVGCSCKYACACVSLKVSKRTACAVINEMSLLNFNGKATFAICNIY